MCQQLLLPLEVTDGKKSFWLDYDTHPEDTDPNAYVVAGEF